MIISKEFGKTSKGESVKIYTLTNKNGTRLKITEFGAILVSLEIKDKNDKMTDVFLGYDTLEEYEKDDCNFGAIIGRNCNRIGKGEFTINGVKYQAEKNDGDNNLHSGKNGIGKKVWKSNVVDSLKNIVEFTVESADMEQDFPGNMEIKVTYTLGDDDSLRIDYEAKADKDTIANMTNHMYINLDGHDAGDCLSQRLKVYASTFTPTDKGSIPTGEIRDVKGTPFDFLDFHVIGDRINDDYDQLNYAGGYDHNYIVDGKGMRTFAEAISDKTGIKLTCESDCPAVQLYAGNYISGVKGKDRATYEKRQGFCLETQYVPDAMNHDEFESPILKANDAYKTSTVYKFEVVK
ncbi:MAG: galactose mutarotase [Lachnospiraceae bacterium]|nr:galactose mutarotase [Lachnospiraceae bacterium]